MSAASSFSQRLSHIRRSLHRIPELGGSEHKTTSWIESYIRTHMPNAASRLRVRRLPHSGLIVDMAGQAEEWVCLRADIDALPIKEETGVEWASEHENTMHACGHDGHTAQVLGAMELLLRDTESRPLRRGIRFILQPAEETSDGALSLIRAGALEGAVFVFGGHLDNRFETGQVVVASGAVNASVDDFVIELKGEAAHAARPHLGNDTVVLACELTTSLHQIVSRRLNPTHLPAVLTVGSLHAGTANNVIAGSAKLEGTVRALSEESRAALQKEVQAVCQRFNQRPDTTAELRWELGPPALRNAEGEALQMAREAAQGVEGMQLLSALPEVNLGGEDFAEYLAAGCPGVYVRFGCKGAGTYGAAHTATWDFDEVVMPLAAQWFAEVAKKAAGAQSNEK